VTGVGPTLIRTSTAEGILVQDARVSVKKSHQCQGKRAPKNSLGHGHRRRISTVSGDMRSRRKKLEAADPSHSRVLERRVISAGWMLRGNRAQGNQLPVSEGAENAEVEETGRVKNSGCSRQCWMQVTFIYPR